MLRGSVGDWCGWELYDGKGGRVHGTPRDDRNLGRPV